MNTVRLLIFCCTLFISIKIVVVQNDKPKPEAGLGNNCDNNVVKERCKEVNFPNFKGSGDVITKPECVGGKCCSLPGDRCTSNANCCWGKCEPNGFCELCGKPGVRAVGILKCCTTVKTIKENEYCPKVEKGEKCVNIKEFYSGDGPPCNWKLKCKSTGVCVCLLSIERTKKSNRKCESSGLRSFKTIKNNLPPISGFCTIGLHGKVI